MSAIFRAVGRGAEFVHDSSAPVDLDGARPVPALLSQHVKDVENFATRGLPFTIADLPTYIDAVKNLNGAGIDDRKFLLEKLLTLMSRLPEDSQFSSRLQQFLIDTLYKDLPHPPSNYLALIPSGPAIQPSTGRNVSFAFRSADGTDYNPLFPSLGRAGSPYARSVPSVAALHPSVLPDTGLVFDALMRRDKFVSHPGGMSSLFFAFADLVIHSIFHTNARDWSINDASSYLDLSPLYGNNQKDVDSVRRNDGTGRLWDDVFADSRILFMPPTVCALLVLLSRNHNFIAEKILSINEKGNFSSPPPTDKDARRAQDDEIFHRTRLVNCGFFMQIILGDYVGAILGLVRDGTAWRLNPLQTMRQADHAFSPQGEGNVVSIEFNLLYRWHATMSEPDTLWLEEIFKEMFPGKDFSSITLKDFQTNAPKYMRQDPDVRKWKFGGLERTNGRFNDSDLARIIQDATEHSAGAFRARGTPEVFRIIEILAMEQSRSWGTCSLNEFRKFIGLKPYSSFKEWNPDPAVHTAAEALYHDIDNLELYSGLQAEEAKSPMPGSGLCPGYTISRSILADAVCLTRGDRFLTVDFTPYNFTSWGYQDCQFNKDDGSYGGMLTKLLFRTLPDYFPASSAYAHFPFLVPGYVKASMSKFADSPVSKYKWTRPHIPGKLVVADQSETIAHVLADNAIFTSCYERRLFTLTKGAVLDRALVHRLLFSEPAAQKWSNYFHTVANQLVAEKSYSLVDSKLKYLDVVENVINLVPVYWIANEIIGLPIKNSANPRGIYRPRELIDMFSDVCNYVYLNTEPVDDWELRESATKTADKIIQYVKAHLAKLSKGLLTITGVSDSILTWVASANDNSDKFLSQLLAGAPGHASGDVAASLFAESIPTIAYYSQAITQAVNFYLDDVHKDARHEIAKLARLQTPDAEAKILVYIYEALRSDPVVAGVYRDVTSDTQLGSCRLSAGDRVYVDLTAGNADTVPAKPVHTPSTGALGIGELGLVSSKFFDKTAPQIFKAIFSLNNISRGPGNPGKLSRFTQGSQNTFKQMYIDPHGNVTPWAASLTVQYSV